MPLINIIINYICIPSVSPKMQFLIAKSLNKTVLRPEVKARHFVLDIHTYSFIRVIMLGIDSI